MVLFHFSSITTRQCCALYPFRNPNWNLESLSSKNADICLNIHFSNIFDTLESTLNGLKFSLRVFEPFLWTGVTLANFISVGNFVVSTELLKQFVKNSENISQFSLITFVGISESCVAFVGSRFIISFSISSFSTWEKENKEHGNVLCIARILGWFLYFTIALIVISSIFSASGSQSSYFAIFRFETALIKNLLRTSDIVSSESNMLPFSTKVISSFWDPLFDRNGFTVFQNLLLSVTSFIFKLL